MLVSMLKKVLSMFECLIFGNKTMIFCGLLFICCCLKGYSLQVKHKQDWVQGFILSLSQLLCCPDQVLAVMVLSQH